MRLMKILVVSAVLLSPVVAALGCTSEHTTETKKNPFTGSETKTDKTTVNGN